MFGKEYIKGVRQTQSNAIGIRNDGGHVVFSPSTIDGKPHQVVNDTDIKPMPSNLKTWLMAYLDAPSKANGAIPIARVNATGMLDEFSYLAIPDFSRLC